MAHIKIAIFLYPHHCTDELAPAVFAHTEVPVDFIVTHESVTDYKAMTDVKAFITADGEWIDVDQMCWLNLGITESDHKTIFSTLLRCFYIKACSERQQILIVDCHI